MSCCSPTVRLGPFSRMGATVKRAKGANAMGNVAVGMPLPVRAAHVMPVVTPIDMMRPNQAPIHVSLDGPIENVTNWFRRTTRARSSAENEKKPDDRGLSAIQRNTNFLPSSASSVRQSRARPDLHRRMQAMSQRDRPRPLVLRVLTTRSS